MQEAKDKRQIVVLRSAVREGRSILNKCQYAYVVSVVKRLVDFDNREELVDLRIEKIGEFYELKIKGGALGNINLRIYFAERSDEGEIVILKAYKKEEDGQVGRYIIINVEDRLEDYIDAGSAARTIVYRS